MTCPRIVPFNFSLNPDIKLNSVDKDTIILASKSSSNLIKSEDFHLNQSFNEKVDGEKTKRSSVTIKNFQKTVANNNHNNNTIKSNFNESSNSQENTIKSNMNNGLSNGHDLNLDFDLANDHLISPLNSPSSFSTSELSNTNNNTGTYVNPVSSSSSCPEQNILINSGDTMGILTNPKSDLSQNFSFLKSNKIENGQSLSSSEWDTIKTTLMPDKVDILPQIQASPTTTALQKTINLNNENVSSYSDSSRNENIDRINIANSYMIKSNNLSESLNLVQNCDETKPSFDDSKFSSNSPKESFTDGFSPRNFPSSHEQFDYPTSNNVSDPVPKEEPMICNDLLSKQQALHQQCSDIKRRIRRLQVQYTHKNLAKQMKEFVSQQQRLNSIKCQRFESLDFSFVHDYQETIPPLSTFNESNRNDKFKSDHLNYKKSSQSEFQKLGNHAGSTSSNIKTFLKSHVTLPKNSSIPFSLDQSDLDFSPNANNSNDLLNAHSLQQKPLINNNVPIRTPKLSQENQKKLFITIDSLRYNLRHLESKYDSDATDSSSGGESCDELEETNTNLACSNLSSSSTTIRNCSSWKWCNERSAIASRWSWLQAQIADLETKLRQQNDVFKNIRAMKGFINFGHNETAQRQFPSFSPANNPPNTNSNCQQINTLVSSGNNSNSSINSLNTSNILLESNKEQIESESEEDQPCMRSIPFISMKRRKLIYAENTLSISTEKDVRYSSVKCSCNIYPPYVPPCAICYGRPSYMHSIDPQFMTHYERISLLDSSCHHTLCLPNDVPLGLHLTAFLKQEKYKIAINRTKKKKSPNTASIDNKLGRKSQQLNASLKAKKKALKNKKRRLSSDSIKKNQRDRLSSGCSSRAESPVPSPSPSDGSSTGASITTPTNSSAPLNRRRRSEQHVFDINNIVIPYSIAATTRVERLQYKEIITPKWRLIEKYTIPPPEDIKRDNMTNDTANKNSNNLEDISDNAFQVRHSKCELIERQRIMTYYGNHKNQALRKGSRVRFESSKSDSLDQTSQESFSSSKIKSKAKAQNNDLERKRHSSISKSFSRDDSVFEDHESIPPYETRKFPLPEWLYEKMVQETYDQKEEEHQRSCRLSVKFSHNDYDSMDDAAISSCRISPETVGDSIDLNDDESDIKGHLYRDDGLLEDDPEWKPPKI